jgi:predicted AAA+ superfamily ATPase
MASPTMGLARLKLQHKKEGTSEAILVIDEIQKIPGWSEVVKRLWDEDTKEKPETDIPFFLKLSR